jgi:polar amino acid transport system permease protein
MYDWDFGVVWQYKWVFVEGAWITLKITFFAIIFGTIAGFILGLGRSSASRWVRLPVSVYVELFLALPILVLMIWIYYCGPLLAGITLSGFWAAVVALSLTLSAYVAEIVRSGLLAVPTGHAEAARVLGMTQFQAATHIVIPQAIRVMVPPMLGMYISTLKMSSLASVIAVYELLHSAQTVIMDSFRPLEIYTTVAVMYVMLVLPFTYLTRRYEFSNTWKLL